MADWELAPEDEGYPQKLCDLGDNPPKLYGRGDIEVLNEPCLSIIGARRATPYGLAAAEMAGRVAVDCGIVVVSGGALGCDYAASRAALDAGGKTVIVTGTGADQIYPRSSAGIFREAAEGNGCVLSIEPWGTPPARHTFPKRNHIIAALSSCLFVTEAGQRSGTMSTAEAAREMGRTIFGIPGSIFSPYSTGTNRLIADGAIVICDECDLEMAISMHYGVARLLVEGEKPAMGAIISALMAQPMRPQELSDRLNMELMDLFRILSEYEGNGLVERMADGRYSPTRKVLLGKGRIEDR